MGRFLVVRAEDHDWIKNTLPTKGRWTYGSSYDGVHNVDNIPR